MAHLIRLISSPIQICTTARRQKNLDDSPTNPKEWISIPYQAAEKLEKYNQNKNIDDTYWVEILKFYSYNEKYLLCLKM